MVTQRELEYWTGRFKSEQTRSLMVFYDFMGWLDEQKMIFANGEVVSQTISGDDMIDVINFTVVSQNNDGFCGKRGQVKSVLPVK